MAPRPQLGPLLVCLALSSLAACEVLSSVPGLQTSSTSGTGLEEDSDSDTDDTFDPLLDVDPSDCAPPAQVSCDESSDDPLQAVGLDCLGGTPAVGEASGPPGAISTQTGSLGPYEVREGEKFLILSTGIAGQLRLTPEELAQVCADPSSCPSTSHDVGPLELPAPLDVNPVDSEATCVGRPELVGTGDCSNSLFEQWAACGGGCQVWDYAELRMNLTTPEQTYGLAFDFAFVTVEWPLFVGGGFNDMFVAWLESESWTGNISFDGSGNPITVNAGFTDYTADELDGTAMEGHAGTRWLTTDVGLNPGETIELVLAIFDLSDGDYDSAVLLDGFRWTCSASTPTTAPVP